MLPVEAVNDLKTFKFILHLTKKEKNVSTT